MSTSQKVIVALSSGRSVPSTVVTHEMARKVFCLVGRDRKNFLIITHREIADELSGFGVKCDHITGEFGNLFSQESVISAACERLREHGNQTPVFLITHPLRAHQCEAKMVAQGLFADNIYPL